MLDVITTCPICGNETIITVPFNEYMLWKQCDMNIQDALWMLSPEERELLISGICGDCWENFEDLE